MRIFVAASLAPVLQELTTIFEQQQGVQLVINAASSGTLARQIQQGAPADLFISANEKWVRVLSNEGMISKHTRLPVMNQLVLITTPNSPLDSISLLPGLDFSRLLANSKLAIGDPNHVPAGQYARQAIDYLGWNLAPDQTLLTKDARATLVTVELGETGLGIVYRTDAEKSGKVKIIGTFPARTHQPINYFAGICSENRLSTNFINFLHTPEAFAVWKNHGFAP